MRSNPTTFDSYVAITPHATDPLPNGRCKSIYVGGAGTVIVAGQNGDVTFTAVAGQILPIETSYVRVGTATGLVALY